MPPTSPPTEPSVFERLEALPQGAPAEIAYVVGTRLHRPGRRPVSLGLPRSVGRYGVYGVRGALTGSRGGWLVSDGLFFEGTHGLWLVTELGAPARELGGRGCTAGKGAAAPDGRLAWVVFSCPESEVSVPTVLHVRGPDGTERTFPLEQLARGRVLSTAVRFDGDSVVVVEAFGVGRPRLVDVVTGEVAIGTRADLREDPGRREDVSYGPRGSLIWVHRDTGERTVFTPPDGTEVGDVAWEDDGDLLVEIWAHPGRARTVVRVGPGGRLLRAGPVVREQIVWVNGVDVDHS